MALTDNLKNYWKLDETSGSRVDTMGLYNLTDNNTVGYATGKISNGADFIQANSESLSSTLQTTWHTTGSVNRSVSVWFKPDVLSGTCGIVGHYDSGGSRSWLLYHNGTSLILLYRDQGAAVTWGTALATGNWYHVVATFNSSNTVEMFVNGSSAGTNSVGAGANSTSGVDFRVGAYGGTPTGFFDGIIDEIGWWEKVLTGAEITELYNGGAGLAYPFSSSGPAGVKTWNGLAQASVKTVNGLAIASVKTANGLA